MAAALWPITASVIRVSFKRWTWVAKALRQPWLMKLPNLWACLWAWRLGNFNHKLHPECLNRNFFRTGVRLSSSPPKRNGNFRQESCRFFLYSYLLSIHYSLFSKIVVSSELIKENREEKMKLAEEIKKILISSINTAKQNVDK